jgi:predicted nucleic acid-binding protein
VITVDTAGLLALLDRRDPDHDAVVRALHDDDGPYVVPAGILAEACSMIETRLGARVLDLFLTDLAEGSFLLDCGEADLGRIRELIARYSDLPLGFADAAVIACAERSGGRVLTLDSDFLVVGREIPLTLLP